MDYGSRLKRLRTYRDYSPEQLAEWLKISRQAWYKKETSGSITLDQLGVLCERADIDARYFTGQIEEIEEADLRRSHRSRGYEEVVETNRQLAETVREFTEQYRPSGEDPVLQRVRINRDLYELAELLSKEESRLINKVYGLAYALKNAEDSMNRDVSDQREQVGSA